MALISSMKLVNWKMGFLLQISDKYPYKTHISLRYNIYEVKNIKTIQSISHAEIIQICKTLNQMLNNIWITRDYFYNTLIVISHREIGKKKNYPKN